MLHHKLYNEMGHDSVANHKKVVVNVNNYQCQKLYSLKRPVRMTAVPRTTKTAKLKIGDIT